MPATKVDDDDGLIVIFNIIFAENGGASQVAEFICLRGGKFMIAGFVSR